MGFSNNNFLIYILLIISISTIQAISSTTFDIYSGCLAPKSDKTSLNNTNEIMISKNWGPRSVSNNDDKIKRRHFTRHIKLIQLKIRKEFKNFKQNFNDDEFISQEEKKYILSCEDLIIESLNKISKKIENGKMRPWKKNGDVNISVFSGTYDYPTMAHLLLMLDNLADPNISSDFVVLFLEPDSNNKDGKINNYVMRERLIKILIEPFGELLRFVDYGRKRKYLDVVGKLMKVDYPEASNWIQVSGSDVFQRFGKNFHKEVDYLKENYYGNRGSKKELNFGYHIYNRGFEDDHISIEDFNSFVDKNEIPLYVKKSPVEKLFEDKFKENQIYPSVTAFKSGELRLMYPAIVNVLYTGYQLKYSWDNGSQQDRSA